MSSISILLCPSIPKPIPSVILLHPTILQPNPTLPNPILALRKYSSSSIILFGGETTKE